MAQTLPNGVVVPNADGGEQISATGVAEMRTLGASVDARLGAKADTTYVDTRVESVNFLGGRITTPVDAFTLPPRIYTVSSVQYAGMVANLPEAHPGTLVVEGNTGQAVRAIRFLPHGKSYSWETSTSTLSNEFMPWRKSGAQAFRDQDPALMHRMVREQFTRRRGGTIGTSGLPVVALRWDQDRKSVV